MFRNIKGLLKASVVINVILIGLLYNNYQGQEKLLKDELGQYVQNIHNIKSVLEGINENIKEEVLLSKMIQAQIVLNENVSLIADTPIGGHYRVPESLYYFNSKGLSIVGPMIDKLIDHKTVSKEQIRELINYSKQNEEMAKYFHYQKLVQENSIKEIIQEMELIGKKVIK